jgi:hypothetical protein
LAARDRNQIDFAIVIHVGGYDLIASLQILRDGMLPKLRRGENGNQQCPANLRDMLNTS